MSSQDKSVSVSEDIKQFVRNVMTKNNFSETSKVEYYPGSNAGDGYASKTFAVDIIDGENSMNLFIKCPLNIENKVPSLNVIHANELYFYKTVYPTYTALCKDKGVKDGFRNVPKCYGFNETKGGEILVLENLKKKGYTLFDRSTLMNDAHLKLLLQSFAKFHALSFAMKDQQKDLHDEFCEHCPNIFAAEELFPKMISNYSKVFVEKLNAIEDKDIFERCKNLHSRVFDQIKNIKDYLTDYSIFAKGDCWINNMMILYENDDKEHPKDVMLFDWQCVLRASPVHDFEGLFYSVASKESIRNYRYYMEVYYEELSKRIEELGSNPDVMYPRSVFEKDWISYGVYALGHSLAAIKAMLYTTESFPSYEDDIGVEEFEAMFVNLAYDEEEYLKRSKYLIRHMISIGVL